MSTRTDGGIGSGASILAARLSLRARVMALSENATRNGQFLRQRQVYLNFCNAVTCVTRPDNIPRVRCRAMRTAECSSSARTWLRSCGSGLDKGFLVAPINTLLEGQSHGCGIVYAAALPPFWRACESSRANPRYPPPVVVNKTPPVPIAVPDTRTGRASRKKEAENDQTSRLRRAATIVRLRPG